MEVRLRKGADRSIPIEEAPFEDFDISFKPVKLSNDSCDVYSLGIIILEVYLSLYVHKRDCKEMVHNLYLNKLTYQSRCILLNQILDNKANPIICQLIKEMLKDCTPINPGTDTRRKVVDEKGIYDEMLASDIEERQSAAELLSKNRIIHYLAYISDNKIDE